MRALRAAWLALVVLGAATAARADTTPRLGADANPADLNDPFAYALNPAVAQFTRPQVAAGFQVLHWGLLPDASDLNTGGVVWAGRQDFGGLTLAASWLGTPLWADRQLSAGYGRRVLAGLSLGVSAGIDQRAFDRDGFDLSGGSTDDPLLAGSLSKAVPILSFAASYSLPLQGVTAGLVLENPHEPGISLDDSDAVTLAATLRAGLAWEGAQGQLTLGVADDAWRTRWSGGGRWNVLGEHGLLARLDTDRWSLGMRVAATPKIWVEYTFTQPRSDLAAAASGSHGLVVCLHPPGREPPPVGYRHRPVDGAPYYSETSAQVTPAFPSVAAASLPRPSVAGPQLQAVAAVDTALIRVKRLVRVFAPDVDLNQVRRLPRWRIGVLDSSWSECVTWDPTAGAQTAHPEAKLSRGAYSDDYRSGMGALRERLDQGGPGLVIMADAEQLERARFLAAQAGDDSLGRVEIRALQPIGDARLREMLFAPVGRDSIAAVQEIVLREYPAIPIRILVLGEADEISGWTLEIRDSGERPVRAWAGMTAPPAAIGWDWNDADGRPVAVDTYTYQLTWRDRTGQVRRAPRREILIARQTLQRTLEFGRDQAPLDALPDVRPVLILDPGQPVTTDDDRKAAPAPEDLSRVGLAPNGRNER